MADTAKYVLSSMRRYFELAEVDIRNPFECGPGASGGLDVTEEGDAEEGGSEKSVSESDLMISSGASRTAESMMTSVICCRDGVISVGFHCSSSTSLAEREIRA